MIQEVLGWEFNMSSLSSALYAFGYFTVWEL